MIAQGIATVRRALPAILEDQTKTLSGLLRELLLELRDRLRLLDERLHSYDLRIENLARSSAQAGRLMTVARVGPLTATALIAAFGNAQQFRNGRQLSAWLGLVPAQNSSGDRTVLLGISKRGDRYLRTLLIYGARIALYHSSRKIDPTSRRVNTIKQRRGYNVATVALANKNARVLWALLTRGESYSAEHQAASHPAAPGRLRAAG